jgi:hypothetical protein
MASTGPDAFDYRNTGDFARARIYFGFERV